jgi:sugar phosphate isomerase/epimerase
VAELLATCWTSAGNVRPGLTADASPIPLAGRISAIAATGYSGIGLELADLEIARATIGYPALLGMITDAGLRYIEVEFLNDWWVGGARRGESDDRRRRLLDAAAELGALHVKTGGGQPADRQVRSVLVDEFGRLAEDAADAGTRIALEPGAGSGLDLIEDAIPLVVETANPSAGILLDPWHLYRSGTPYGQLVGLLPREYLFAVELSDAPAAAVGTFFDDTFDNRLAPGDGAFDVPSFIRAVTAIGFDGPWGVEVMSTRTRSLPVAIALAEAAAGARAALAAGGVS